MRQEALTPPDGRVVIHKRLASTISLSTNFDENSINWLLIAVLANDQTIQQVTPIAEYRTFDQCASQGSALRTSLSYRVETLHERRPSKAVLPSFVWHDCILTFSNPEMGTAVEDFGKLSITFATAWEAESADQRKME